MSATLLSVYGPPAVGKRSVAEAVARRTGFKLLHNHAVIDAVTPLFPFGEGGFRELVETIRHALFEAAVRERIDVITTYGYVPEELAKVRKYAAIFRERGGDALFVQLVAAPETLVARVGREDRQRYGKLTDPDALRELLARWDFTQAVPDEENLVVDTDTHTAEEAADLIVQHFGLGGRCEAG